MKRTSRELSRIYELLNRHFGDLRWWPARSGFEVMVGTVLTQNTAWSNVVKAIRSLRKHGLLTPGKLLGADLEKLEGLIRPAGYFRIKADRLKRMCRFVMDECGGRLSLLKKRESSEMRQLLLSVKGIGPETADSILLYALEKPVFVVDAYTRRIFSRHGLISENARYEDVKTLVEENFPMEVARLNQFHALLVETAKSYCKKNNPLCNECPLGILLK
ncbi:MAG: hypothetical protein GF409_03385 [Candidatus Omnitrophica bacterium]|nr:hypothetical protein [Candidatus Omnitrophota bacterium]